MAEKVKGLLRPGNADTVNRKPIDNGDGTASTVRSMSFNDGKREVLIPTAFGDESNRVYTEDEAIDRYNATGEHLGWFDKPENATKYAIGLHESEAGKGRYNPQAERRASSNEVDRARAVAAAKRAAGRREPDDHTDFELNLGENVRDVGGKRTVPGDPGNAHAEAGGYNNYTVPTARQKATTAEDREALAGARRVNQPEDGGRRAAVKDYAKPEQVPAEVKAVATLLKVAPEDRSRRDLDFSIKMARVKNAIDTTLTPKVQWAKNNVPGVATLEKMENANQPKPARQPVQMQREFSNEDEKQAYLDRVKAAMDRAKQK